MTQTAQSSDDFKNQLNQEAKSIILMYEYYLNLYKKTDNNRDEKIEYLRICFVSLTDLFQLYNDNEEFIKNEKNNNPYVQIALNNANGLCNKYYDYINESIIKYSSNTELKEIFETVLKNMNDFVEIYEFRTNL
jgi:coenzyme F420-reducing hydrogenase alpha subunit